MLLIFALEFGRWDITARIGWEREEVAGWCCCVCGCAWSRGLWAGVSVSIGSYVLVFRLLRASDDYGWGQWWEVAGLEWDRAGSVG